MLQADRPAYIALVLHSHLPFVRHPEHEVFLEEDWFYEALTETYLPLLKLFRRLRAEGVSFRLTLSLSSTLLSMLGDPLLQQRYARHLAQLIELIERELKRTRADDSASRLARHYHEHLCETLLLWEQLRGDVVGPLAELEREGFLDLLTSGATHGYLPLLAVQPQAVWAQIAVAVELHRRVVGRRPPGIWLPECGYAPGIDSLLARAGLRFFVTETHGVIHARPRARFGCYAPLFCTDSGVAAFGRDPQSAEQVWSRERGYPGDPVYREFYRDIGFDLPETALAGWAGPDGRRRFTGIKYHRITGPGEHKELYDVASARARAWQHARDFVDKRMRQLASLRAAIPQPVVVAPYDAELFGHWWYEGVQWLEAVLRQVAALPLGAPRLTRLSSYLQAHPTHQVARPSQSSWGEGGYHRFWLDGSNAWIYPRLHAAAQRMIALARRFGDPSGLQRRSLQQAARELLLAQASDWAFIMRSRTVVQYAVERTQRHLSCFDKLAAQLEAGEIDSIFLSECERRDNVFPQIDYAVYASECSAGPSA